MNERDKFFASMDELFKDVAPSTGNEHTMAQVLKSWVAQLREKQGSAQPAE